MRREQILKTLRESRGALEPFGITQLFLFGSAARDEATDSSDVDLLVEFAEPLGLVDFIRLRDQLEELLGSRVDLVTRAALKPQLRDRILSEAVRAA